MTANTPTHLTVETLESPLAVPTSTPRFGWHVTGSSAHVRQSAYEIQILNAHDRSRVASSGRVQSDANAFVALDGVTLASRSDYIWRVRVWIDGEGESPWAESRFGTTLLNLAEWQAPWIEPEQRAVTREPEAGLAAMASGPAQTTSPPEERLHPAPMIRQSFQIPAAPSRARLYITARGLYDVLLNGRPISDEIFAPGHDEHTKRLSYQTYDVTSLLQAGANVIGVTLSDGFWAGRTSFTGDSANYGERLGLSWQLELDREIVAMSDASARSSFGAIRYADVFIGEKYDARAAQPGWATADFDASEWSMVQVTGRSVDKLVPFIGEPVRRVAETSPLAILRTPAGETIIDVGQNMAGRIRLRATGPRGTEIKLEHTEALDRAGNYQTNIIGRNKDQTDFWILAGNGEEQYEPTFTYHGFRYVRVSNYPGELTTDKVTAIAISSDLKTTGAFETDNPLVNRLHSNVFWSQRSNFLSIPTDCPQRERAGWTGDAQIFAAASTNNMQAHQFWTRWLANVRAAQQPDGSVPHIVPNTPSFSRAMSFFGRAAAGWGDAITIVPLVLYDRYGDLQALSENYEAMKAWHQYVRNVAETELPDRYREEPETTPTRQRQRFLWNTGFQFGDWLTPSLSQTQADMMNAAMVTGEFAASAFYFHSTRNLARTAHLLGDVSAEHEYETLSESIKSAFQAEFIEADGRLKVHYQGPYVLALEFGLIPAEQRDAAGRHLADLVAANNDHLDCGFLSLPFLLDTLVGIGRKDLAYKILLQDSAPSWLYQINLGATTIWEEWRGVEEDGQPRSMSLNHYAFGAVDDWLFRHVAGIKALSPGYKEIEVAPDLASPFMHVNAEIATPSGPVRITLDRNGNSANITVVAPANTQTYFKSGQERRLLRTGSNRIAT